SKRIYVPSRRRCSLRVRTITAFTTVPFLAVPSGEASFTEAVITSPKWATRPVEPPSGRIICSLRAPELSATSSMVLIITAIISSPYGPPSGCPILSPALGERVSLDRLSLDRRHQGCALHDFFQIPALQFRERSRLFDLHDIPQVRHAFFVVRVVPLAALHYTLVERVGLLPPDFDHNGLGHLGGHHFANQSLAAADRGRFAGFSCFGHGLLCLRRSLLGGRFLLFHWRRRFFPWCRRRGLGRGSGFATGQFLLALHRVDAGNVLLQLANLLQALGLSHLQLKLHLEELVRQLALLMKQFGIGQISYLLYIHGSNP